MEGAATTSPGAIRRIMIVVAMEQELKPILEELDLQPLESPFLPGSPFMAWGATLPEADGVEVQAIWCGRDPRFGNVNNVATTAAAVATYAALQGLGMPDLLVSAGTAGGFASMGASVGDVFHSTKCIFHSRRIPSDLGGQLEEYGFGHLRSPPLGGLAATAGLKPGVVSTSDSLDATDTDLELMRSEGTSVKEMEAAAVAWVCSMLGVPFVAIKAITDIVDSPRASAEEFYSNLSHASARLQQKVGLVVRLVAGTALRDWATPKIAPRSETELASCRRAAVRQVQEHPEQDAASQQTRLATIQWATGMEVAQRDSPPLSSATGSTRYGVALGVLIGVAASAVALVLARTRRPQSVR